MKKMIRTILCLLLCALLIPVPGAKAGNSNDIRVRILLKRLALTDRIDMILTGAYTAASGSGAALSFPAGSSLTVQVRSDRLYLFYEGMSLCAGGSLTLTGLTADSAVRFDKNGPLYPGTLSLTVSGGQLRPILTLGLEDYLRGVVPYEMSNSFPLEALKAQAVCARTYAVSRMNDDRDYDMTDTTEDQVFMGINPANTNTDSAILETEGIIVTWKGRPAQCWYAASNGGQTELPAHVWAGDAPGCYAVTDDPYDVENPESIVRKATLPKNGAQLSEAVSARLYPALIEAAAKEGYIGDESAIRIDGITAVSVHTPRYAAPNRLMTKIDITVTWSGRKLIPVETPIPPVAEEEDLFLFSTPTPSPVPEITPEEPTATPAPAPTPRLSDLMPASEPLTVTLNIFPDVIREFGLSVYGADNELITVRETDTAFVLESRRYGHGVGMSQRGAEQMAGVHHMTYTEILAFYYPGSDLQKASTKAKLLPTPDPELLYTPGPPATPTPRPTLMPVTTDALPEGAYLASVENIEDDSSLNLRREPAASAEILMRMYRHQKLIVLEVCEDPEWVHVKTDSIEGYCKISFLEKEE
ncbi:MAG: SpoIID/LytB domain-containing protein [Clostridia bacterium]|nr:SpoIID/LytB domain-containing protein [Clostridia bacterium]